jgi:hypothetical protein
MSKGFHWSDLRRSQGDITVRASSNSTCCPSIFTKLSASDIQNLPGRLSQYYGDRQRFIQKPKKVREQCTKTADDHISRRYVHLLPHGHHPKIKLVHCGFLHEIHSLIGDISCSVTQPASQ